MVGEEKIISVKKIKKRQWTKVLLVLALYPLWIVLITPLVLIGLIILLINKIHPIGDLLIFDYFNLMNFIEMIVFKGYQLPLIIFKK